MRGALQDYPKGIFPGFVSRYYKGIARGVLQRRGRKRLADIGLREGSGSPNFIGEYSGWHRQVTGRELRYLSEKVRI
jgi:hypothetical protein